MFSLSFLLFKIYSFIFRIFNKATYQLTIIALQLVVRVPQFEKPDYI
jgi:hypothetical protein